MASDILTSEEQHQLKRAGWLLMFVGLLSVAVGVIVLLKPSDSLVTLAVIAGIFILNRRSVRPGRVVLSPYREPRPFRGGGCGEHRRGRVADPTPDRRGARRGVADRHLADRG